MMHHIMRTAECCSSSQNCEQVHFWNTHLQLNVLLMFLVTSVTGNFVWILWDNHCFNQCHFWKYCEENFIIGSLFSSFAEMAKAVFILFLQKIYGNARVYNSCIFVFSGGLTFTNKRKFPRKNIWASLPYIFFFIILYSLDTIHCCSSWHIF